MTVARLSTAVVGPGAIGTTVAAALHGRGHSPLLCGRSARDHLDLQIEDRLIHVPGPVRTDPAGVDGPVDLVFLGVKATQLEAAGPWLDALCRAGTVVCVLQNGVEQEAMVSPYAPDSRVLPAVVWFPAQAQSDGTVWLRGEARLTVPDVPAAEVVLDALHGSVCSVELAADFTALTWHKLLQNAVAGLMALTGRRAGMYARTDVSQLALAYLQECLDVARAEGAVLDDDLPRKVLEMFQGLPADVGTSILVDREAGRPLEWDIRNGVVQRRGRAHGIPTPISDLVVPLLAAASDGPG